MNNTKERIMKYKRYDGIVKSRVRLLQELNQLNRGKEGRYEEKKAGMRERKTNMMERRQV